MVMSLPTTNNEALAETKEMDWPHMDRSVPKIFGAINGYLKQLDAQLKSHLGQVKFSSNGFKSLGQAHFTPNFSKIIVTGSPENFRSP